MKKILFVMPLMAISLLASCNNGGGGKPEATYTITFDCQQCKAFNEDDEEVTSITVPAVDPSYKLYKKFYFTGDGLFKTPLKSSIAVKKTGTEETVDYKYVNGEVYVPIIGDITISAKGTSYSKELEDSTWAEIAEIAETGRANEFFDVGNTKNVQLTHQDLDDDGEIDDNEIYQTVRIIDFNKDINPDGNNLGITFEFANYISDSNGYSLASLWQNAETVEGSNYNYIDSTIRKNLTGDGRGSIMWYEKGSGTISKGYTTSVYDLLPNGLQKVLKTTRKKVNLHTTGDWVETDVDDKLFLLSANEMNTQTDSAEKGEAYEYYKNAAPGVADPIRIKRQVKGSDGATTLGTEITESAQGTGRSYAGYDYKEGGNSWLRSPDINIESECEYAWCVRFEGLPINHLVHSMAHAVAPAFCI